LSAEDTSEKERLEAEVNALGEKRRQLVENLTDEATQSELAQVTSQLKEINRHLAALPPPKKVYAAASDFKAEGSFQPAKTPRPVHLLARGDVKRPGELMSPGGIACVPGPDPQFNL